MTSRPRHPAVTAEAAINTGETAPAKSLTPCVDHRKGRGTPFGKTGSLNAGLPGCTGLPRFGEVLHPATVGRFVKGSTDMTGDRRVPVAN